MLVETAPIGFYAQSGTHNYFVTQSWSTDTSELLAHLAIGTGKPYETSRTIHREGPWATYRISLANKDSNAAKEKICRAAADTFLSTPVPKQAEAIDFGALPSRFTFEVEGIDYTARLDEKLRNLALTAPIHTYVQLNVADSVSHWHNYRIEQILGSALQPHLSVTIEDLGPNLEGASKLNPSQITKTTYVVTSFPIMSLPKERADMLDSIVHVFHDLLHSLGAPPSAIKFPVLDPDSNPVTYTANKV